MKSLIGLMVTLACMLGLYLTYDYQPQVGGPEYSCTAAGWCKRVQQ